MNSHYIRFRVYLNQWRRLSVFSTVLVHFFNKAFRQVVTSSVLRVLVIKTHFQVRKIIRNVNETNLLNSNMYIFSEIGFTSLESSENIVFVIFSNNNK